MKKFLIMSITIQIIFACFECIETKVMAYQTLNNAEIVYTSGFDTNYYKPNNEPQNADTIKNLGNKVIGMLQVIGSGMSILMLVVIGIKYMLGSVEEKAEYKEAMKPYLIGAVLVFGITNLLGILNKLVGGIF